MMKDFLRKYKKGILGIGGGILLLIIVVFFIIDAMKTAEVSILVVPHDASVYINGVRFKNGTYRVFPDDSAEVRITAPGFEEKTFEIELNAGANATIQEYLRNSENGLEYYVSNTDDYNVLRIIANDEEVSNFIQEVENRLMIRAVLPLVSYKTLPLSEQQEFGRIDDVTEVTDATSDKECDEIICLEVSTNTGKTDVAESLLKEKGFNLSDYKIILTGYPNS